MKITLRGLKLATRDIWNSARFFLLSIAVFSVIVGMGGLASWLSNIYPAQTIGVLFVLLIGFGALFIKGNRDLRAGRSDRIAKSINTRQAEIDETIPKIK